LDQFSVDYRYSLQENLYMLLHIFAMPRAAQGLHMTDPMSVCFPAAFRISMWVKPVTKYRQKQKKKKKRKKRKKRRGRREEEE
jgi:hypothetical protein